MSLYTQWPLGLRPNRVFPPRIAMDSVLLGRSDNKDMELAEQISKSVKMCLQSFVTGLAKLC